jgi:hypothetical protein
MLAPSSDAYPWCDMSEAILTASISFVAAVVAVFVGQLLGQRFQRQADERRWVREDAARRRVRGEEVAREVRRALLDAVALFEGSWVAIKPRGRRWEYPARQEVEAATERAVALSIEVPDDDLRVFVRLAAAALRHTDDVFEAGGPEPLTLARAVAAETDALIGAYLRGERLPTAVEVERAVAAAGEWQAQLAVFEEHSRAERQREPAERHGAAAAAEAAPSESM